MSKEVLQITLSKAKIPKSKLGNWVYWKVYFPVWKIWRPLLMSKIYWVLSEVIFNLLPRSEQEKLLKESEEINIVIKNKCNEKE